MLWKDLNRTAAVSWCPSAKDTIYMAAGSISGSCGFDFNSNAKVEILRLDPRSANRDADVVAQADVPDRFSRMSWTRLEPLPMGLIAGGCANGSTYLWDAQKLMEGSVRSICRLSVAGGVTSASRPLCLQKRGPALGAAAGRRGRKRRVQPSGPAHARGGHQRREGARVSRPRRPGPSVPSVFRPGAL